MLTGQKAFCWPNLRYLRSLTGRVFIWFHMYFPWSLRRKFLVFSDRPWWLKRYFYTDFQNHIFPFVSKFCMHFYEYIPTFNNNCVHEDFLRMGNNRSFAECTCWWTFKNWIVFLSTYALFYYFPYKSTFWNYIFILNLIYQLQWNEVISVFRTDSLAIRIHSIYIRISSLKSKVYILEH